MTFFDNLLAIERLWASHTEKEICEILGLDADFVKNCCLILADAYIAFFSQPKAPKESETSVFDWLRASEFGGQL